LGVVVFVIFGMMIWLGAVRGQAETNRFGDPIETLRLHALEAIFASGLTLLKDRLCRPLCGGPFGPSLTKTSLEASVPPGD
jgi:hypothetical protein